MTTDLTIDQAKVLTESASFQKALKDAEGTDAIQRVFSDNGIEMTKDEVALAIDYARKYQRKDTALMDGQLDNADLDLVVGGADSSWQEWLKTIGTILIFIL